MYQPLADLLRPQTLDEVYGQEHILGKGAILRRLVDSGKVTAQATAAALADLGLLNGKTDGGTAHYYVSDTPDNFAELEQMFLGEYAGGPVERIAIETY